MSAGPDLLPRCRSPTSQEEQQQCTPPTPTASVSQPQRTPTHLEVLPSATPSNRLSAACSSAISTVRPPRRFRSTTDASSPIPPLAPTVWSPLCECEPMPSAPSRPLPRCASDCL